MPNGQTVAVGAFVRRQTPGSAFSHYDGTEVQLLTRVSEAFPRARPNYRDGVLTVDVAPEGFWTSVCQLREGDELRGRYVSRAPGEAPRKSMGVVGGQKVPAVSCAVILYRKDVLAETGENTLWCPDCLDRGFIARPGEREHTQNCACARREPIADWEIISINASPTDAATPIPPMTLLHNHFGSDGGTATNMSAEELIAAMRVSMDFWRDKALAWPGGKATAQEED